MRTRPALSQAAAHSSESAPSSVTATESIVVQPIDTSTIDNQNIEETRIENFTDDRRIGRRRKNKIEIRCFSRGDERLAEIKFYSKTEYGAWIEAQSFRFEKDGVTDCDPIVEDFNNDGLRDFTYQSTVAARGANEVRRLFIYDKEKDELVYIKNSQEYPNLAYNKKLNCIDAFLVYGATSTVFLRIEGDTLREFASVDTGEELVVSITEKSGEKRVMRRKKMNPDNFEEVFRRFSSYSPPR
jgi:hypothetical protein